MRSRGKWWWLLLLIPVILLAIPGFFFVYDAVIGVNSPYKTRTTPRPEHPDLGTEWPMHPVANPGDWLPNGLDAADVNGDGRDDYVTNYELRGRIQVALHPGSAPADEFWQGVEVGQFPNAESSAFGDLDGDGWYDVIVTHGVEHTDEDPGVHVAWGEPGTAWNDGGDIPASQGGWHFLYVRTVDLDGDADEDIVVGGRADRVASDANREDQQGELIWAGIRWFENPASGGSPRDLSAWDLHTIDAEFKSGHGFEFGDLDGDGDLDLVDNNADWDTPNAEEMTAWFENPGTGADAEAWARHVIYQGSEFYGKEQVKLVDMDQDGDLDILNHTELAIYWFQNQGGVPVAFERVVIEKHPAAQWRSRPLAVADLNADGLLDIVGALIHRDGILPQDKAAIFWMEQNADGSWTTHVVKWGDGFWGMGTFNGEKWDQIIPADIDGDGDLDLIANVEEYNRLRSIISVVWFENTLVTP